MEPLSRLRHHLGESAYLVDVVSKRGHPRRLLDFTKTRRGEEIILIEVGGHGITVEYAASGHKSILAFEEIQINDRTYGRARASRKSRHVSGKGA